MSAITSTPEQAPPLLLHSAAPPTDNLPRWLNDIERAVYEATTSQPQTTRRLTVRSGYSESRVREAVGRLTSCDPPLLMRSRGGVRRMPASSGVVPGTEPVDNPAPTPTPEAAGRRRRKRRRRASSVRLAVLVLRTVLESLPAIIAAAKEGGRS